MRRWIALLVALSMVGGAVAVPVVAQAAPAKSAKAAKAKKKKAKKKKRKKAASKGAQGTAGPQGPAGPAGPAGTTIVARARLAAPMTISTSDMTPVPLTGAKWTQQADESDDFIGEATVTLPRECTVEGPGPTDDPVWWLEDQMYETQYFGGGWGELKLGSESMAYVDFPVFPEDAGKTITRSFYIDKKLMEPGTPTERELSFQFGRYCEGEGQEFRIDAVKINVVGIR